MKLPFCLFCVKSGVLCLKCQEKLEKEGFSELDLKLSQTLLELSKKFSSLNDIVFHRVLNENNHVYVIVGKGGANILFSDRRIIKHIERSLKKKVKVIEKTDDKTQMIRELIPVKTLGINRVYYPGGLSFVKAIVKKKDYDKIERKIPKIVEIIEKLTGQKIVIESM